MQTTTRYALPGIAALAALEAVHYVRREQLPLSAIDQQVIGSAPNFFAAIAISFVLLAIWSAGATTSRLASSTRAFLACAAISGLSLTAWEFAQQVLRGFVFDTQDLWATLAGIFFAALLFITVTPPAAPRPG